MPIDLATRQDQLHVFWGLAVVVRETFLSLQVN